VLGRAREWPRSARLPARIGPSRAAAGAARTRRRLARFVAGSIDLLYRDDDGRLVVVDYKTDRVEPSSADAGERRARYAQQGALYCRAIGEALGADPSPRFELWWLRSGAIEPLGEARVR
jgi:ATP-dependent helicase/nuclease subunit A